MVDTVDRKTRSRIMSRIRSRNTKPERMLHRAMRRIGLKPRRWVKALPGKPDFYFPHAADHYISSPLAVFVDGCFWHGCPRHGSIPKTRKRFWQEKIYGNQERDLRTDRRLHDEGTSVMRIWECEVKEDAAGCAMMVARFLYLD